MYLDTDTSPPIKSCRTRHPDGYTARRLQAAVTLAEQLLTDADAEGQIGIYDAYVVGPFRGYVIRYKGQAPYFEAAEETERRTLGNLGEKDVAQTDADFQEEQRARDRMLRNVEHRHFGEQEDKTP